MNQKKQCSELIIADTHFRDHLCRIPATVFEHRNWWCSKHSEAGMKRARRRREPPIGNPCEAEGCIDGKVARRIDNDGCFDWFDCPRCQGTGFW